MTDRRSLDLLAARAWPALEKVERGGWLLRTARTADGRPVTKRANSALALDGVPDPSVVVDFYASRGLPPSVQVSDPAVDARLDAAGWAEHTPVLVLTGLLPRGDGDAVAGAPSPAWLRGWVDVGGVAHDELDTAARCLAQIACPAGYVAVVEDGRTVAVGRGVVEDGWLGVFAMGVLPERRRQGLGARVLGAIGDWAAGLGAERAYLQVEASNAAARGLYAGLEEQYAYHYRRTP